MALLAAVGIGAPGTASGREPLRDDGPPTPARRRRLRRAATSRRLWWRTRWVTLQEAEDIEETEVKKKWYSEEEVLDFMRHQVKAISDEQGARWRDVVADLRQRLQDAERALVLASEKLQPKAMEAHMAQAAAATASGLRGKRMEKLKGQEVIDPEVAEAAEKVMDGEVGAAPAIVRSAQWDVAALRRFREDALRLLPRKPSISDRTNDGGLNDVQVQSVPLWTRQPADVTNEDYANFYKSLTNDREMYLAVKHYCVAEPAEPMEQYRALLFVPRRAPPDLLGSNRKRSNIKLFTSGTPIVNYCGGCLPDWLNFVEGVVDSKNLPVVFSRNTLQDSPILCKIRQNLVMKCLEMFAELAGEKDDYKLFYAQFSECLKLGAREDPSYQIKIAGLMRYQSSKSCDESTSLKEHYSRWNKFATEVSSDSDD